MKTDFYRQLFNIDDKTLETVTAAAMAPGIDYADLYFEHTTYRDILLRDSAVSSAAMHIDSGVGIRSLCGEHTGYSYCDTCRLQDMVQAAKAAASIASSGKSGSLALAGNGEIPVPRCYLMDGEWKDVSVDTMQALLLSMESKLRAADSRIVNVIAKISSSVSHIAMYNSLGEFVCDTRPMGSIAASIMLRSDGRMESCSCSRSYRSGSGMLTDSLISEMVKELLENIDPLFEAKPHKGGKMDVVMGAGASGILLHEAMGHAFEADFNRKGQSIFADKMGKRICPQGINILDDATVEGNRGSCRYDDEGVPGQKTYMVTDGILTSYLHDRISAAHFGVAPTGNGRRESYRYHPIPRMRLTYMENGSCDPGSIIAGVKKGVFVDQFSNGQVKIGEGDFTFYVKCGYLIENGKLTQPVKDINVIGNGPRALADIVAVGNDLKIDNSRWTCGKDQNVPVGCGMPTILVRNLTVGGIGK